MCMNYTNFQYAAAVLPQLDAGAGYPLFGTGDKPRVVFQLCCYQGTNTQASEVGLYIIPSTAGDGIQTDGTVAVAGDTTFPYGKVDSSIAATTEQAPMQFAPFGTKGTTNGAWACIIPPNCLVVLGIASTSADGTIIAKCISAELD